MHKCEQQQNKCSTSAYNNNIKHSPSSSWASSATYSTFSTLITILINCVSISDWSQNRTGK